MIPGQKEDAEVLRHGLLAGCRTVADVVAWADSIIAADTRPDIAIIEVATSARRSRGDVMALLRTVPGDYDPVTVVRRFMADLRVALTAEPNRGPEIADHLYQLAISGELPLEQFGQEPYSFGDRFDLAQSGIYGTNEDVLRALDAYLARHSRPS